jgi:hypothetical protein
MAKLCNKGNTIRKSTKDTKGHEESRTKGLDPTFPRLLRVLRGEFVGIFFPRILHLLVEETVPDLGRDLTVGHLVGGLQAGNALAQPFGF